MCALFLKGYFKKKRCIFGKNLIGTRNKFTADPGFDLFTGH
jgi:hypothetical protein